MLASVVTLQGCYAVRTVNEGASIRGERRAEAQRDSTAPAREAQSAAAREALDSPDCERIPEPGTYNAELLDEVADKAAGCGQWAMVFEDLMQWGNGPASRGVAMLQYLQHSHDVEAAFLSWATDTQAPFANRQPETIEYALSHYFEFLEGLQDARPCQDYDAVLERLPASGASIVLERKYGRPECAQPRASPTSPESAPSPAPTSTSNG